MFTAELLKKDGILVGLRAATKTLPKPLYLHFDIDVIDAAEMPALAGMRSGVHYAGGLSLREMGLLSEGLAGLPLAGMDVTLYDPNLDRDRTYARKIIDLIGIILPSDFGMRTLDN